VDMWVKRDIFILKIPHAAWRNTWNSSKRILIVWARSTKRYIVNSFLFVNIRRRLKEVFWLRFVEDERVFQHQ